MGQQEVQVSLSKLTVKLSWEGWSTYGYAPFWREAAEGPHHEDWSAQ
jgi:hypothetical protein